MIERLHQVGVRLFHDAQGPDTLRAVVIQRPHEIFFQWCILLLPFRSSNHSCRSHTSPKWGAEGVFRRPCMPWLANSFHTNVSSNPRGWQKIFFIISRTPRRASKRLMVDIHESWLKESCYFEMYRSAHKTGKGKQCFSVFYFSTTSNVPMKSMASVWKG